MKNRYTLGLLATLCLLTSSFGIKAMENGAVANDAEKPFLNTKTLGLTILSVGCGAVVGYVLNFTIKRHKENKLIEENKRIEKKLIDQLNTILRNQNGSPEENLKEFIETLAALEKIAGSSIGKIIDDNLLLHLAAKFGKTEAIKALIEKGADIEAKDIIIVGTALCWAAYWGNTEAIKVLVAKGADIEAKDEKGRTPLRWAVINRNTEAIKVLVGYDADVSDIFFQFDEYIPLVFEKCICGNRGNNTEKINRKINEALEKTKEKTKLADHCSIVEANTYKRLYRDLKNSLIVIQNLSGIRIGEDKRVGIQKISLDELGMIMSFTDMDFGKNVDAK